MPDLSYLQHNEPDRFRMKVGQATMKAVVTTANGGYDRLDYRDVPIPQARSGELLLRVLAAGVNNTEINTRLGWYSSSVSGATADSAEDRSTATSPADGGWNESTPFPLIQGTDCCGRVVALGEGCDPAWLDQRVLVRACMRLRGFDSLDNIWMASDFDGAFAEYLRVPASEVFALDCDWSDAELATIPCAYGTAENMLQRAGVSENDCLLVTGASGGVGSALVQLARRRGARVLAQTSAGKVDDLRALGAETLLRDQDLVETLGEKSVDVVIDNVAGRAFGSLIKLLGRGGRYVSSGAIAGPMVSMDTRDFYLKDLRLIGCTAWDKPVFPALVNYIEANEIRPLLARSYALADIVEAQKQFLLKQHVGKFVLIPPD